MRIHVLENLQYCDSTGYRNTRDTSLDKTTRTKILGQYVLVQLLFFYGICSCTGSVIKCIKYII